MVSIQRGFFKSKLSFVILYGNIMKHYLFEADYDSINNIRKDIFYENKFKCNREAERTFSECALVL